MLIIVLLSGFVGAVSSAAFAVVAGWSILEIVGAYAGGGIVASIAMICLTVFGSFVRKLRAPDAWQPMTYENKVVLANSRNGPHRQALR